jgi:hypothetical protein
MKKTISIILIICLILTLVSCIKEEKSSRDIITKASKSELKFKPEIGAEFNTESALYAMKGIESLIGFYKSYEKENFVSAENLITEAEEVKNAKDTYAKSEKEKEVYGKILQCYNNFAVLSVMSLELEKMKMDEKMNVGGVTKESIKERENLLKTQKGALETSIADLFVYFEL